MSEEILRSDVAIIGGGIAGIVTAYELLEYGKKVILFDRDREEKFGGLAKESFGGMFFVNTPHQRRTGIKDSPDLALKDWHSFAEFKSDARFPVKWAEKYVHECNDKVYQWLLGLGIKYFPVVHWVERGLLKPGNSVPRFHMVWGTGKTLTEVLINKLQKHKNREHLTLCFEHFVQDLEVENQKVTAVIGINEKTNTSFRCEAEHFVIASGGIGGNLKKIRSFWPERMGNVPKIILNGSHQYADGHLHDLVSEKLDGSLTHMENMWHYAGGVHHHRPQRPGHGLSLIPPRSALWVNYKGERFGPMPLMASFDTSFLVEQVCKQEKQYSWQILNRTIAVKELAVSGSEFNHAIREKKFMKFIGSILFGDKKMVDEFLSENEDFITAESIEELAEKMNSLNGDQEVDVNLLRESIKNYDSVLDRGLKYFNDEQLRRISYLRQYRGDRARICKFQKIDQKNAYPLIAIREFILSRKSLGGLETDLECRVLDQKGDRITGVYAVGEAAGFGGGGIHGKRSLEGTFLGSCVLTGREAARTIAAG